MDNKQESLQFKIFMDGVNLSDLHLHKKLFQTKKEKLEFINSYLTLSELEQYKYHNIGRGVGSAIRRKLINYISSLPSSLILSLNNSTIGNGPDIWSSFLNLLDNAL